jgi:hypothetical protein
MLPTPLLVQLPPVFPSVNDVIVPEHNVVDPEMETGWVSTDTTVVT